MALALLPLYTSTTTQILASRTAQCGCAGGFFRDESIPSDYDQHAKWVVVHSESAFLIVLKRSSKHLAAID